MGQPTGTVTLVFSDMEGSTRLLRRLGDRYVDVLADLRSIQRSVWARHDGFEIGTEGDSFFVAFASAAEAVGATVEAQRALQAHRWCGDERVLVRMGLHTGTPVPYAGSYVGIDVHRAARIAAAAHGGQVLLSAETAAHGPVEGVSFRRLGRHRLRDLAYPEELLQAIAPGIAADFPPVRGLGSGADLPRPAGRLVGRDRELAQLVQLLDQEDVRLVSLTGPGGSGKTRLAVELAHRLAAEQSDGVYFVALESATTPNDVWTGIASGLDVPPEGRIPPGLFEHLSDRRALLVLDNLEQVSGVDEVVAELLDVAPGIRVVATVRTPLHVAGEHERPVAPLALPTGASPAEAAASPAVQLFVQRAALVVPGFALDDDNTEAVVAVCRELDGLPLAVEIAAARLRFFPPAALIGRLSSILDLPSRETRRPSRHRNLRAAIRWSYDLLDPEHRQLFRLLGALPGGGTPTMIHAVADRSWPDAAWQPDRVVTVLEDLADASLVRFSPTDDGDRRVDMLHMVRAFATEELATQGERDVVSGALFVHLAAAVLDPGREGSAAQRLAYQDRVLSEYVNLRAVMGWLTAAPWSRASEVEAGLRLRFGAAVARHCGTLGGYHLEALHWARDLLRVGAAAPAPARAELMFNASELARVVGNDAERTTLVDQGVALLGLDEPWAAATGSGSPVECLARFSRGHLALDQGDRPTASAEFGHALEHDGASMPHLWSLVNLAIIASLDGDFPRAQELEEQAMDMAAAQGDFMALTVIRANRACTLQRLGRATEALEVYRATMPEIMSRSPADSQAIACEDLVCVLVDLEHHEEAAVLLGAADELRRTSGMPRPGLQDDWIAPSVAVARRALGARWDELCARGAVLGPQAAMPWAFESAGTSPAGAG